MKQKSVLIIALVFLLAGVAYMFWDMFFRQPESSVNPYALDMKTIRGHDTLVPWYGEVQQIRPGLAEIYGIAVDKADRIYVAGEKGVEIYDPAGKRETSFVIDGAAGCIQVDKNGLIYLGMEDHLEIFNKEGKKLVQWNSCGGNAVITSIAVSNDCVFIADAGNKVVYRYDHAGNLQKKIGEKDPHDSIPGFVVPSPWFDLAIDRRGFLWVVNPGRHCLEQFTADGSLISSWGKASMAMEGFCGCCNPSNFAFLSDGSFVTSEKAIERVKVYTPAGDFSCVVAAPGSFDEGTRGLDLAVDSKERILVLDPVRKQVRIFVMKR
ncbi:MAG: NHL repeat-containing protein [Bacteroidota bacterium]